MDSLTEIMGYARNLKNMAGIEPFNTLPSKRVNTTGSKHQPVKVSGGNSAANISPSVLKMLLRVLKIEDGDKKGAIGKCGTKYVAEYASLKNDGTIDIAAYNPNEGIIQAVTYDTINSSTASYSINKDKKDGTVILMAMYPELCEDTEFKEQFELFKEEYKNGFPDITGASAIIAMLSDNVYYRLKDDTNSAHIQLIIPSGKKDIPMIKNTMIMNDILAPNTVILGDFEILNTSNSKASSSAPKNKKKGYALEELISQFNFDSSRILSEEEKTMVPKIHDWFVIPKFVMDICKTVKETVSTNYPMTNFTLRGGAGTGKSKGTEAIAAGFNLPHVFYTCSADTEIFDFIGQVMPASKDSKNPEAMKLLAKFEKLGGINSKNIASIYNMPSLDDVQYMPDMIYEELSGEEIPNGLSESEKIALTYSTWHKTMEEKFDEVIKLVSTDDNNKFIYTETNFIKAIKNGWVVEIQEPNVIASPGVLVGLNGLLEEGIISLPTGEVIERHPDTVVIFTTNVTYNGCRTMNQSVIDRSNELYDVETPDLESMAERVKAITEYPDEDDLLEMATIVKDINDTMFEMGIDDGSCGMRSLISWAMKSKITGDPYAAALTTVISKCSNDKEARESLLKRLDESSFRATKRTKTI